jgi:hypothetical protein
MQDYDNKPHGVHVHKDFSKGCTPMWTAIHTWVILHHLLVVGCHNGPTCIRVILILGRGPNDNSFFFTIRTLCFVLRSPCLVSQEHSNHVCRYVWS